MPNDIFFVMKSVGGSGKYVPHELIGDPATCVGGKLPKVTSSDKPDVSNQKEHDSMLAVTTNPSHWVCIGGKWYKIA